MAKRKTPLQQAYYRERKRIQNYLSRYKTKYSKFGLGFDISLPRIPKRITEGSIRKLQGITPEKIKQSAYLVGNRETGEVIATGIESIKKAKDLYKNAKQEDIVLRNLEDVINFWRPEPLWNAQFTAIKQDDRNRLKSILEGVIMRDGRNTIARRCEEKAFELQHFFEEILYGSGKKEYDFQSGRQQVNDYLVQVANILNGRTITPDQAIELQEQADSFDFYES